MKISKIVNTPIIENTDVICDICGSSCKTEHGFEYMKLKAFWGFDSHHDLEKWTAQVCESCVIKHLESLIKFNKEGFNINGAGLQFGDNK
jgi:hypothetical protein